MHFTAAFAAPWHDRATHRLGPLLLPPGDTSMRTYRRTLLSGLAALALALPLASPVAAQTATIPSMIRIIVPFAPGASTDVIAREIAAQLGPRLGVSVIVENRAGASGFIGATASSQHVF